MRLLFIVPLVRVPPQKNGRQEGEGEALQWIPSLRVQNCVKHMVVTNNVSWVSNIDCDAHKDEALDCCSSTGPPSPRRLSSSSCKLGADSVVGGSCLGRAVWTGSLSCSGFSAPRDTAVFSSSMPRWFARTPANTEYLPSWINLRDARNREHLFCYDIWKMSG